MRDKIAGALFGMALGDAMGMPAELWGRKRVKDFFGRIEGFLDGPAENDVAFNYKKGQFTDDTGQALVLSLIHIRDRAMQMAALLMGRVRAMPIRADTRIPMMKGCISVAVFTRFPNQFMNWATPGPTNWATSTPEIMVMPGVTMMSRRVSLDTILPNSAATMVATDVYKRQYLCPGCGFHRDGKDQAAA